MYSEDDILLLIKFIVKEFAHIVQKWISRPALNLPFGGVSQPPQSNLNQMLLSALLVRETTNLQNQEMIQSQLMQQVNSILLSDMIDQNKNNSGDSSPLDRTKNVSVTSYPQTSNIVQETKQVQEDADMKLQDEQEQKIKDDIETVQSSEDKTHKVRTISEDIVVEQDENKIDLKTAYSILEKNHVLNSLIKTFTNTNH